MMWFIKANLYEIPRKKSIKILQQLVVVGSHLHGTLIKPGVRLARLNPTNGMCNYLRTNHI